jgi:hypothetical protein
MWDFVISRNSFAIISLSIAILIKLEKFLIKMEEITEISTLFKNIKEN